jgi:transposase
LTWQIAQRKNVIFLDETGFNLGISREYSYAPMGVSPSRLQRTNPQRMNMIMAITEDQIIAYQLRNGAFNEIAFIGFLIAITDHVRNLQRQFWKDTVLFMDNAAFHRSSLAMRLYKILPFTVVFNAPYNPYINPIERVFGIIKRRIKMQCCQNM